MDLLTDPFIARGRARKKVLLKSRFHISFQAPIYNLIKQYNVIFLFILPTVRYTKSTQTEKGANRSQQIIPAQFPYSSGQLGKNL